MSTKLHELDTANWQQLSAAVNDTENAFRNVTLSNVGDLGEPQLRIVVLRQVDVQKRVLWFHTDTRSRKWQQITKRPEACALGYDRQQRMQLRLNGKAHLHAPGSSIAMNAWQSLPEHTRNTYFGGPPGAPLTDTTTNIDTQTTEQPRTGELCFGLLELKVATADWYTHQREDNRRAIFHYSRDGDIQNASWVYP